MKELAASGVGWVRMDFSWSAIETGKGKYVFSEYDRLLASLQPYRIRPIFILDYSNRLYDGGLSPSSDEGVRAFARWAAASVSHFRGHGIFWEMYNEPNGTFWRPKPDTQAYIRLALAVGEALHETDPGETYIGPASALVDLPFLEACFKAGLLNYWSAVSVHPYRKHAPETAASEFRALRLLISRYAPPGKHIPIIAGEWGYSSAWQGITEEQQAKMLARAWLTDLANDVPLSIWYDWHDDGNDPQDQESHFGLVRYPYDGSHDPVYTPKPAYRAARTLTTLLGGYRFNKRLAAGNPEDYVLLFTRSGHVRVVAWTTSPTPHKLIIPASPGRFRVTSLEGQTQPAIIADKKGLPLIVTDSPQYLQPEQENDLLRVAAAWQTTPLEVTGIAPRRTSMRLSLKNPLPRAIRISAGRGRRMVLPPGKVISLLAGAGLTAALDPVPLRIEWEIEGMGRIAQETYLVAVNPLWGAFAPATPAFLPLMISNPSGKAFRGEIALTDVAGLRPSKASLPLEFRAGETHKLLQFPLASPEQPTYQAGAVFKDAQGHLMLNQPAARFERVDDFSRYQIGSKPQGYGIVPDRAQNTSASQAVKVACPAPGPPLAGMGCLKVVYHFDPQSKQVRLEPAGGNSVSGEPKSFGMWIYSDGSGNVISIRLKDNRGRPYRVGGRALNWKGWMYLLFPLSGAIPEKPTGGGNEVLQYPIRCDSLLVIDSAGSQRESVVYLSGPTWIW